MNQNQLVFVAAQKLVMANFSETRERLRRRTRLNLVRLIGAGITVYAPANLPSRRDFTMGLESGLDAVALERSRLILKYQSDAFQRAIKHHPKIAFGPDYDPDFLPNEFAAMVEGGLTPIEALQTATTHGAEFTWVVK